jgi:hypothetical protein
LRSTQARLRRALRYRERWTVQFIRQNWRDAVLWRGTPVKCPRGHFHADPFVVTYRGRTCIFAEDYVFATGKAHVSAFELTDAGAVELGIALQEPHHISFPYIFQFEGRLFMCPESRAAGEIRIYECVDFPLQWRLRKVAMRAVAADTMIFFRDGLWWMLANISHVEPHDCGSELHVFWATTPLTDEWQPHECNPVISDPMRARNGGLLVDDEELVRVAQSRRFGVYGNAARLFRITRLTPQEYAEEPVSGITPEFAAGIHGSHHFHSNGRYSVWDAKRWERI